MQASATWDKFRKESDFHRMHHKRVAQEKNRLISDLQRLKKHYSVVRRVYIDSLPLLASSFLIAAPLHQMSQPTGGS